METLLCIMWTNAKIWYKKTVETRYTTMTDESGEGTETNSALSVMNAKTEGVGFAQKLWIGCIT